LFALIALETSAQGQTIDFEDAFDALGQGGNPSTFYQSQGLTVSGGYFGLIEGVSRGDAGRFNLEGTAGAASLAANDQGHSMSLQFASTQNQICIDIGTAFFEQEPDGVSVRLQVFNGVNQVESRDIFLVDSNRDGMGEWLSIPVANFDRVIITQLSGSVVWAIDNIRFQVDENCQEQSINNAGFIVIPLPEGRAVIVPL